MKERLIYRDRRTGDYKVLENATGLGSLVTGDIGVVPIEDVIPRPRRAHPPLLGKAEIGLKAKKVFSYIYCNGYIAVAETVGVQNFEPLQYKNYSLVRRLTTPDFSPIENKKPALRTEDEKTLLDKKDLGFLEWKFFSGQVHTREEKEVMKLNFVLADNFFVFKGRAWFATRFKLWTGKLTDGKNFKGTITQVQNVPRQPASGGSPTAFEARYHHIIRVWIGQTQGSAPTYTMIAEEQVVKEPNKSASNSNFHVVLNEYTSTDLDTWTFNRVLAEDTNSSASSGLYAGYLRILKPAKYEHIVGAYRVTQALNLIQGSPAPFQYQVTNLPTGYQRPKLHHFKIAKEGDKLYAYWTHALGDRQVYESADGLGWTKKTVVVTGNKQGDVLL
jgi:hypothetical protein